MNVLDWLLGRNKEAKPQAEIARPVQQERPRQPEASMEPEIRPGARMMPGHAVRMNEAHERKPEPEPKPEPAPERTEVATKMGYTVTPQRAPSPGGGVAYVNPLAQQPRRSVADEMLAEARAERARQEAAKTPEQKLDDELRRLEQPDYSRERLRWDDDQSR